MIQQKNIVTIVCLILTIQAIGQKVFLPHIFTADPSAHVWKHDTNTLWIYSSHDAPNTNHHATMADYHVFSTTDMVNWIDHGRVLSLDDVDWAAGYAWAIDAVYYNNKYYLVYCMVEEKTSMFRTGLAVSDVPQGPFDDIGFIKGVEWGQDPALFIDDDNTPYLFWGLGKSGHVVQLTKDLTEAIPETYINLTEQLTEIFEGPWIHKYKGKYYCSYPALTGDEWPEEMCYAMADKVTGPYKFMGKYIPQFKGQSGTNHGSIAKFKGEWYAFHHSAWLSNGLSETRNINIDRLAYNQDGSIVTIVPDTNTLGLNPKCIIHLEAEEALKQGGKIRGAAVESNFEGYSGKGYIGSLDKKYDNMEVLVQVASEMKANLKIRIQADKDAKLDILVGNTMMDGWNGTPVAATKDWKIVDFGEIQLKEGDNRINISSHYDAGLKVDYFIVEPIINNY
ncbi:family 43 glycosylhydrolase [Bacteroidales bacterium]|nr:family 43 glycosylhydrolase [Bacteroidales bacterium]